MNLETQTDFLYMNIEYNIKTDEYKVSGTINDEGKISILEAFLSTQVGQGADNREPNIKDVYHIKIKWYPENYRFVSESNVGNFGLRDGILLDYLKKIKSPR